MLAVLVQAGLMIEDELLYFLTLHVSPSTLTRYKRSPLKLNPIEGVTVERAESVSGSLES